MTNEDDVLRARITALTPAQRAALKRRLEAQGEVEEAPAPSAVGDFGRQFARGLSTAGHATAAGALDLVGADETAERVRQSRRHNEELYGEPRGTAGKVGQFTGRVVGDLPLFLAPEAAVGRLGKAAELLTSGEKVRRALAVRAAGAAAMGTTEAGANPEESLANLVGAKGASKSAVGRAVVGAAGGEAIGELAKLGLKGGQAGIALAVKRFGRPGTNAAVQAAETGAAKVGKLLEEGPAYKAVTLKETGKRSPEAVAKGWTEEILPDGRARYTPPAKAAEEVAAEVPTKTRIKDVAPKTGEKDSAHVLDLLAEPEDMARTKAQVSRLKTAGALDKTAQTEAQTLEAARNVDVDDLLKQHAGKMLEGPESQALRIAFGEGNRQLAEVEKQLGHMPHADPAREALEAQAETLSARQDEILTRWTKGGTTPAQALRLRRMDHELAASRELATGKLDPLTWFKRAERELGPTRELTQGMRAQIRELVDKSDATGLAKFITGLSDPISFWKNPLDWFATFRKAGLISGPASALKSVVGNPMTVAFDQMSRPAATLFDLWAERTTGQRTVPIPFRDSVRREAAGALRGVREGLGQSVDVLAGRDKAEIARKLEMGKNQRLAPIFGVRREAKRIANIVSRGKLYTPEEIASTPVTPLAQAWTEAWKRVQGAADKPIHKGTFRASLATQAETIARDVEKLEGEDLAKRVAELEAKPTSEMQLQAIMDADVSTSQHPTTLAKAISGIRRGLTGGVDVGVAKRRPHPFYKFGLDMTVPFSKVPSASVTSNLESTPLGFAAGRHTMGQIKELVTAVEGKAPPPAILRSLQKQYVRQNARATTGLALILLGYKWRKAGLITGDRPQSSAGTQFTAAGKQPFAIHMAKRYWPIGFLSPWAGPLAMGAIMAESEGSALDRTISGGKALGRVAMETPFLKGASDAVSGLEGEEGFFRNMAGSAVPTLGAGIRHGLDTVQRQERTLGDAILNRTPGTSEKVLPQVAPTTGETVKREYSKPAQWLEMMDPFASSPDRTQYDRVLKVYEDVGANLTRPTQLKGESAEAYTARQQEEGKIWNRYMSAFLFSEGPNILAQAGINPEKYTRYHQLRRVKQTDKVREEMAELVNYASGRVRDALSDRRKAKAGG